MPGFDGTGPRGQGRMTGGGRGYCIVGWNGIGRRGFGLRRAPRLGAYGADRWWSDTPAYVDAPIPDTNALSEQIERLTEQVETLSARLDARERGGA